MRLSDTIKITLHYIRSRLLESFMVIMGIALGVGIISAVLSLYSNYFGSMQNMLENPAWQEIRVVPERQSFGGFTSIQRIDPENRNAEPSVSFKLSDIEAAKTESPAADYGYAANWENFSLGDSRMVRSRSVKRDEKGKIIVEEETRKPDETVSMEELIPPKAAVERFNGRAITPEFFLHYGIEPVHGSLFTEVDVESELRVIVLGNTVTELLYPETKKADIVGKRIRLNGFVYSIVGIIEKQPEDMVNASSIDRSGYIPITVSQSYMFTSNIHSLTFAVKDPEMIDKAAGQIDSYFTIQYGDKVSVENRREDYLEQRRRIAPILTAIGLLSSMGLFIASINILNLMLARVVRRRKAIGISAALGGSKLSIFKQYLTESLTLGLLGGILGIGISAVLIKFLSLMFQVSGPEGASAGPELNLSLTTVGLAIAITLVINLIFAVYPAFKASAVDSADTLRT
jgi:putative ABC transport system permease protein